MPLPVKRRRAATRSSGAASWMSPTDDTPAGPRILVRRALDMMGPRRMTAPLADFVSALRLAIAAFGQGEAAARDLTPAQAMELHAMELRPMMNASLVRSDVEATRILYLGPLSPDSGIVEFLSAAVQWAERHPDTRIEICWAGNGDLLGVLRAQLTPPNVIQSFRKLTGPDELVALIERCGLLAIPNVGQVDMLPLAKAMAAGLPVLGSKRCPQVRLLVTPALTGWLFDPFSATDMAAALDAALTTPPDRLTAMRMAARRRFSHPPQSPGFDGQHERQRGPAQFVTSERS